MANCHGDGIGDVRSGELVSILAQLSHHPLHLRLVGGSVAHDALLYLRRSVLAAVEAGFCDHEQGDSANVGKLQAGTHIQSRENVFDRGALRVVILDHLNQFLTNLE
jgi:hypothetical protein